MRFFRELLSSDFRQHVVTRTPVVFAHAPGGADPFLGFQTLERRVERTVVDEKHVVGRLPDGAGNALPVLFTEQERPKDQDVEGTLEQGDTIVGLGCEGTAVV